jgi:hypothetical protein
MSRSRSRVAGLLVVLAAIPALLAADDRKGGDWADKFDVPKANFASTGKNSFFILEPGYQMTFEGNDHGKKATLVITVLDDTKTVDGVETRVVEERESLGGQIIEVSRNYFAFDRKTNDAYYFGEEVDNYKDGKLKNHAGAWESGKNGARYGLFMPAEPKVGQKYYQEIAPKEAMDRAEVQSVEETVKVPAGTFEHCLKTEETTPLEPDEKEHKLYAPGVGLLTDGSMKLVKYGPKAK